MCCTGNADYDCRRAYGPRRAQDQQARASSSAKQVDLAYRSILLNPKLRSGPPGGTPSCNSEAASARRPFVVRLCISERNISRAGCDSF
jgi:hypothetical protein